MTKLILEAGGRRREFRLGDGKLTLGSGEGARLRVESEGLAEVHLDLEVAGGRLLVTPRPGVVPPVVAGVKRAEPFELAPGKVLTLGKVRLWVEDEEGVGAPAVVRRGQGRRRRGGAARVQRERRSGAPMLLVAGITLGVVGIAWFFVQRSIARANLGPPVAATLDAAEAFVEEDNLAQAEARLDLVRPEAATKAEAMRLQQLRERIAERREQHELDSANFRGNDFFELHLEHYAKKWLTGTPSEPKVRYFLERCAEFRRRWPTHPKLDWVERQERRFRGHVDLSQPRTWEDVEWHLQFLVDQPTRDYARAFELLDELIETAEGEDLIAAKERRDRMLEERRVYHREAMEEARRAYEDEQDETRAVWLLVNQVVRIGDEEMADVAARTLARIPGLESHLRGYRMKYPERLEQLLQHPRLEAFAERL